MQFNLDFVLGRLDPAAASVHVTNCSVWVCTRINIHAGTDIQTLL